MWTSRLLPLSLCLLGLVFSLPATASADDEGELIFSDDFERPMPQDNGDSPGNGWNTNSKSRAKGNKQVELKDGVMHVFIHPEADHSVTVSHPAEFTDGTIALRFQLQSPEDMVGVDIADREFKEVHAGHLFAVRVGEKRVLLQDLKSGSMRNDIHEARTSNAPLTEEQKALIKKSQKAVLRKTTIQEWHELRIQVEDDVLSVTIDGDSLPSFQSPGFAHPTKRMLRLAIPHKALLDDVRIWRKK